MAYEILWLREEEQGEWDAFVERHPLGWVTHLSSWKECLERGFGKMRGGVLAIREEASRQIMAGIPIYEVRSPLRGKRLVSTPFATRCDPLISSADQLSFLIGHLFERSKNPRALRIEIRTAGSDCSPLQAFGFGSSTKYRQHTIDLGRSLDDIYGSLHRSCVRQRIMRAEREGLIPRRGECVADLEAFYRLYAGTRRSLGLPALPWPFFGALWEQLLPRRRVGLFLTFAQGRPVAAVLTLQFGGRVSAECLGWDREFASAGATSSVFWAAIQNAHRDGFRAFDFGRTEVSNTTLLDFKRRWGAVEGDLPIWQLPVASSEEGTRKSILQNLFKSLSARVPDHIYRLMSNLAYRLLA